MVVAEKNHCAALLVLPLVHAAVRCFSFDPQHIPERRGRHGQDADALLVPVRAEQHRTSVAHHGAQSPVDGPHKTALQVVHVLVGLAVTNQIINFHPFCLSKHAQGLLAFDGNVGQQLDGLLFGDADDLLGVVGFARVAWEVKLFRAAVVVCRVLAGKQAQQLALGGRREHAELVGCDGQLHRENRVSGSDFAHII